MHPLTGRKVERKRTMCQVWGMGMVFLPLFVNHAPPRSVYVRRRCGEFLNACMLTASATVIFTSGGVRPSCPPVTKRLTYGCRRYIRTTMPGTCKITTWNIPCNRERYICGHKVVSKKKLYCFGDDIWKELDIFLIRATGGTRIRLGLTLRRHPWRASWPP